MITHKSYDNATELTDYLNGIVLGDVLKPRTYELDGKTLTIDGNTVNFVDSDNVGLTPAEILGQIVAVVPAALRNYRHGRNPRLAVTTDAVIVLGAGTANPLLGLPTVDTTVGATAVSNADIVSITMTSDGHVFDLFHE